MSREHAVSEEFYEVEAIVAQRSTAAGSEYLVKWKGYDASQNTWEPLDNLNQAQRVVREFEEKQRRGRGEESGAEEVMDHPQKRRRLHTVAGPPKASPSNFAIDANYPPYRNSNTDEEEYEIEPNRQKSHKKGVGRTEDLEILSVRVGRGSEYIWTVQTNHGQKVDLSLEQVKKRAPLALIDYLVSKLRFA